MQKCLHKKLIWSKITGEPINKIGEQYVPIPLAIAENSGVPTKGQKSNATKSLKLRYKETTPTVFYSTLPHMWIAECVIVEGMFM